MVSKLQRVTLGDERRVERLMGPGYYPEYLKKTFFHVLSSRPVTLIEVQVFSRDPYGNYDWLVKGYEEPEERVDPPHHEGPYR